MTRWEMLVFAYPDEDAARAAFDDLRAAGAGDADLAEAALVERSADGKLHVHDSLDSDAGRGTVVGAVLGGLVGLLGGPVTVVLGAAAGGGLGRAAAKRADLGLLEDDVREFTEGLSPGTIAIVAVTATEDADAVAAGLGATGTPLLRQELAEDLQLAEDEARAADAGSDD